MWYNRLVSRRVSWKFVFREGCSGRVSEAWLGPFFFSPISEKNNIISEIFHKKSRYVE